MVLVIYITVDRHNQRPSANPPARTVCGRSGIYDSSPPTDRCTRSQHRSRGREHYASPSNAAPPGEAARPGAARRGCPPTMAGCPGRSHAVIVG